MPKDNFFDVYTTKNHVACDANGEEIKEIPDYNICYFCRKLKFIDDLLFFEDCLDDAGRLKYYCVCNSCLEHTLN